MTNFVRDAKSGNDWTQNELFAYNIRVEEKSLIEFFGAENLPPLSDSMVVFSKPQDRREAPDDETYKLLHYLDLAHNPKAGQGAALDVFAKELLQKLGYDTGRRIIICGTQRSAQTDGDSKRFDIFDDPEPQLVAEAIAAFQLNMTRVRELHLPELEEAIFPAITICGSFPTFYKIKVTSTLNNAIVTRTYPREATIIHRHIPRLPTRRHSEGMKPLLNRIVLLKYFQLFKPFV